MSYAKFTIALFLFGFLVVIPVNTVYADVNQYEKMLEKIDSLSLILKDKFKADIMSNWNSTLQSQQHTVMNVLDSLVGLEEIYQQKDHPEISYSIHQIRISIKNTETMEQITMYQNEIEEIEQSVNVLNRFYNIQYMMESNEILDSKIYLHNIWDPIEEKIKKSKTSNDILSFQTDIEKMDRVMKYNSRIYENTHSPVFTLIDPHVKSIWTSFKEEMKIASTLTDMSKIAAVYNENVGNIDEKVISKWEMKMTTLENDAKKQKNIPDSNSIEQNIKNLNMVKKIHANASPFDDDSQSKAILYNISQNYLKIKSDLREYSTYLENKSQLEHKATQLYNEANYKLNQEKMPEFQPKIKNTLITVTFIKNALESNDFKYAQQLLGAVEQELFNFEQYYPEIRNYTPLYKQHDIPTGEKKQLYLNQISQLDALVNGLNINQTLTDYKKYQKSIQESKISILYGNFETGHKKIYKAIGFVNEKFLSNDPRIMMDVTYDNALHLLSINGAVYKHSLNSRDKVSFYLYNQNDEIIKLYSRTTKAGDFQILSNNAIPSGLYVAEIHHGTAKESQIVSIQDNLSKMVFNQDEIAIMEIANIFENLENFVNKFTNHDKQLLKIQPIINKIKQDLKDGKINTASTSIQKFKNNIKLYMPIASHDIVIDASVIKNTVKITGAITKLVEYREAIFLTIFDQDGNRIYEQITYDDKFGNINIEIPKHILKGFNIVQIEYHDSLARDVIEIN